MCHGLSASPHQFGACHAMSNDPSRPVVAHVAACTAEAAHRRDHDHESRKDCCRPHVVEVVQLGEEAIAVCHDCRLDSGFLPRRTAQHLASQHQKDTEVDGSVLTAIRVA
jgi:hypothetical protein